MTIVRTCEECGSFLEYDAHPNSERTDNLKDVYCPFCHKYIDTVNSDLEEVVKVLLDPQNYVKPDKRNKYR